MRLNDKIKRVGMAGLASALLAGGSGCVIPTGNGAFVVPWEAVDKVGQEMFGDSGGPVRGRTRYSFAFLSFNDRNNDNIAYVSEFVRAPNPCSITLNPQITFMSQVGKQYSGCYAKVWIQNPNGQFVFNKMGYRIGVDLAQVSTTADELRRAGVFGNCKIMIQVVNSNGQPFQQEANDIYSWMFTQ